MVMGFSNLSKEWDLFWVEYILKYLRIQYYNYKDIRKSYELDFTQFGWRTTDILISVERGDCVEIANRLLTENIGIRLVRYFKE